MCVVFFLPIHTINPSVCSLINFYFLGTEFFNSLCRKVYNKYNITHYTTYNADIKTSISERVIRTLKSKIYRFLTLSGGKRYIHILKRIEKAYNNTSHRILLDTPSNVHFNYSREQISKLFQHQYGTKLGNKKVKRISVPRIRINSLVRLTSTKRSEKFHKGYLVQNTTEIFKVSGIDTKFKPHTYIVKDLEGNDILGKFYESELIPVINHGEQQLHR